MKLIEENEGYPIRLGSYDDSPDRYYDRIRHRDSMNAGVMYWLAALPIAVVVIAIVVALA